MIYINFLKQPYLWPVIFILHAIGYFGILHKMGLKKIYAFIPFLAEKKIGETMFETKGAFWHPFIIACIYAGAAFYLDPFALRIEAVQKLYGLVFLFLAFINYYFYLIRLYWRLGNSFGKGLFFKLGMILCPFPFLYMLGYLPGNKFLHGTPIHLSVFRPKKWFRWLLNCASSIAFFIEAGILFLAVSLFLVQKVMPPVLVNYLLNDTYQKTKNVVADEAAEVSREENMGDSYSSFSSITPSRDLYVSDKDKAKSVVVMEYVIGSDLESKIGAASTNITQFKEATKQGDGLTFVMEAGGSYRWFTSGIENNSVGRYTIQNGNMQKVMDIDSYTSMSNPRELSDFIKWTKDNYPADRYMLVFWDHGAGLSYGYGVDRLNKRDGYNERTFGTIDVDEIIGAIKDSGVKFDMIGFDACLMQDIEIAYALEPYADYFIASEETEPAGGWFYTSAFGKLAQDPTLSTEEFGKELIGSYDPYNKAQKGGKENADCTLSMVDLRYIRPAYEKLTALIKSQHEAILSDESDYIDISAAAYNAYTFSNKEQLDLVNYLETLAKADYNNTIESDQNIKELIDYVKASVVIRNKMSADGVSGLALTFPYKAINSYDADWAQLKSLGLKEEESFYNDYFSIMAASNNSTAEGIAGYFEQFFGQLDHTDSEWYVSGFENYVTELPLINIPIHQNGDGYSLDLADDAWDIIVDAKQFYYKKTEDGLQYLGMDYAGRTDENGHPMITADGTWISIGSQLICYEAGDVRESENGIIYTGTSKARLNGKTEVILYIEWEPVNDESQNPVKGRITGYDEIDNEHAFMEKGNGQLKTGDSLDFLFDYYDEEGKLITTKTAGGTVRVIKADDLVAEDKDLGSCTLQHGILLTDAFQRIFQSDLVETTID